MRARRYKPEEIILKLHEAEVPLTSPSSYMLGVLT